MLAKRSYNILVIDIIPDIWYSKFILTVSNIKALFLINPQKMEELLDELNGLSEKLIVEIKLSHDMAELSLTSEEGNNKYEGPVED